LNAALPLTCFDFPLSEFLSMMQVIAAASPFDVQVQKPLASTRARSTGNRTPSQFLESRGAKPASAKRVAWAFLSFNALLPFVLGFAIYTLWRSTKLLMFRAYQQAGLYPFILALRAHTSGVKHLIPELILYSVPDALWVYGATALLGYLWRNDPRRYVQWFWTLVPVCIAVGSEFGQLFKLITGTFDWADVSCYLATWALAIVAGHLFLGGGAESRPKQVPQTMPGSSRTGTHFLSRNAAVREKQTLLPVLRRGPWQQGNAGETDAGAETVTLTREGWHAN
jgi:hypothetical protein